MPVKAFIFDMDDVLCRYDVGRRIELLSDLSARSPGEIRRAIWESDFLDRADRGEFSAPDFLTEFGRRLGYALSRTEWVEARRLAMTPDPLMLDLVNKLRPHYRLALLTNNDRLLAETIDLLFPELRIIFGDHLYVSAVLGRTKPDPALYRAICARLAVQPDEAFFVDDLAVNIAGANDAGLDGHHFIGYQDFIAALTRRGVMPLTARPLHADLPS